MVEIVNPDGRFPCLLVCDHATAAVPREFGNLGLSLNLEAQHIAVDIGIAPVVRAMSRLLDAPAVLATQSRLCIDTNRWIADPESIPEVSDGTTIPGNLNLSADDRQVRQDQSFWPFHIAVAKAFAALTMRHKSPSFLAVHSCTRALSRGPTRCMDGGTIWHQNGHFARLLADGLMSNSDLVIADNQPYSGFGGAAFTIDYHTWGTGIDACGFEIVNDLIATEAGQLKWATSLASALQSVMGLSHHKSPTPIVV